MWKREHQGNDQKNVYAKNVRGKRVMDLNSATDKFSREGVLEGSNKIWNGFTLKKKEGGENHTKFGTSSLEGGKDPQLKN